MGGGLPRGEPVGSGIGGGAVEPNSERFGGASTVWSVPSMPANAGRGDPLNGPAAPGAEPVGFVPGAADGPPCGPRPAGGDIVAAGPGAGAGGGVADVAAGAGGAAAAGGGAAAAGAVRVPFVPDALAGAGAAAGPGEKIGPPEPDGPGLNGLPPEVAGSGADSRGGAAADFGAADFGGVDAGPAPSARGRDSPGGIRIVCSVHPWPS
jgi:DNA polymerase-3 subunit gamma/tau